MTTSVFESSLAVERLWTISLMDLIVPFLQRLHSQCSPDFEGGGSSKGCCTCIHFEVTADLVFVSSRPYSLAPSHRPAYWTG